nr:unnamed protein product [Callosobruchus analis]
MSTQIITTLFDVDEHIIILFVFTFRRNFASPLFHTGHAGSITRTSQWDIVDILGRQEPEDYQWGPLLHPDVLLRWEHILNSGLSETDVKALILQHLPPENFKAM